MADLRKEKIRALKQGIKDALHVKNFEAVIEFGKTLRMIRMNKHSSSFFRFIPVPKGSVPIRKIPQLTEVK